MKITIPIKPVVSETKTNLKTFALKSGSPVAMSVLNNANFAVDQYVIVGTLGGENTELQQVTALTANDGLTVGLLKFDHQNSTVIYKMDFNQIKVEKSTDNGAIYTPIATLEITGDQENMEYLISGALSTDLYRTRYYNSETNTYAEYSNTIRATGEAISDIMSVAARRLKIKNDKLISLDDIFDVIADTDMAMALEIQLVNPNFFQATQYYDLEEGVDEIELNDNVMGVLKIAVKGRDSDLDYVESFKLDGDREMGSLSLSRIGAGIHYPYFDASTKTWKIRLKVAPIEDINDGLKVQVQVEPQKITSPSDTLNIPNPKANAHIYLYKVLEVGFGEFKDNQSLAKKYFEMFERDKDLLIRRLGKADLSRMVNDEAGVLNEYLDAYN